MKNNFLLLLVSLLVFTGCSNSINKFKIFLPSSLVDMHEISKNIYVDSDMTLRQQQTLLNEVLEAKKNVKNIWGSVESKPIIYACSTKECSTNLGIGGRAYHVNNHIILSQKALSKELISHEYSHAELYTRIDSFFKWKKIPNWFDEGLAVLVAHDARHDKRAWDKIVKLNYKHPSKNELYKLDTSDLWIKAIDDYKQNINYDDIVVIYAIAGNEVSQWYKIADRKGLMLLIESIKNGEDFSTMYNRYNKM